MNIITTALSPFASCLVQTDQSSWKATMAVSVLDKVRKHPKFAQKETEHDLVALAEELTSHKQIKSKFDHLLDTHEMEENIMEIDSYSPTHSMELRNQKEQQKHETARACYLPVQLFLSKLSRELPKVAKHLTPLLRLEFGPLHAGLLVGDVIVEWDDNSLVVPTLGAPDVDVCTYVSDGDLVDFTGEAVGRMSLAHRQNLDVPEKLEIIYQSRAEKERLIDRLVEVIVQYNLKKQYSMFRCNCQDFVRDALKALGVHKVPGLGGNLKAYVETLQGGKPKQLKFETHSELDEYVNRNREDLDTHEKEYCILMYFEFHSKATVDFTPEELERWTCPERSCLCNEVEREIAHDSLHFFQLRKQQEAKKAKSRVSVLTPISERRENSIQVEEAVVDDNGRLNSLTTYERQVSVYGVLCICKYCVDMCYPVNHDEHT